MTGFEDGCGRRPTENELLKARVRSLSRQVDEQEQVILAYRGTRADPNRVRVLEAEVLALSKENEHLRRTAQVWFDRYMACRDGGAEL